MEKALAKLVRVVADSVVEAGGQRNQVDLLCQSGRVAQEEHDKLENNELCLERQRQRIELLAQPAGGASRVINVYYA